MGHGNNSYIRRRRLGSLCVFVGGLAYFLGLIGIADQARAGTLENGGTFTVTSYDKLTGLGTGDYYDAEGPQTYTGFIGTDRAAIWEDLTDPQSFDKLDAAGLTALAVAYGLVDPNAPASEVIADGLGLIECVQYSMWSDQYRKDMGYSTQYAVDYSCYYSGVRTSSSYSLTYMSAGAAPSLPSGCSGGESASPNSKRDGDVATMLWVYTTIYQWSVTCALAGGDQAAVLASFEADLLAGDPAADQALANFLATLGDSFFEDGSGGYRQSIFEGPAISNIDADTNLSVTDPTISGGNVATGNLSTVTTDNGDGTETTEGTLEIRFPETVGVEIGNLSELAQAITDALPEEEIPEVDVYAPLNAPDVTETVINLGTLSQGSGWLPSACPAPKTADVMGSTLEVSFQPACDLMVTLRPFVIALSYLSGLYIVFGIGRVS